nr:MAG TPA_asm: hypothetical protein [Caudoviricetes sp.]
MSSLVAILRLLVASCRRLSQSSIAEQTTLRIQHRLKSFLLPFLLSL